MRRRLEPVDLIVAVGLCATVICVYLFFLSANGQLKGMSIQTASAETSDPMIWIQPALGQAIVEDILMTQEASRKMSSAATQLSQAIIAWQMFDSSPARQVETIRAQSRRAESEYASRAQYIMGRSIVEFTRRGIRTGVLSAADPAGDFNRRMINTTEAAGARLTEQFQQTHQSSLGQDIVLATQHQMQLADRIQERLGSTVVSVTSVQDRYREANEGLQEQLGSVVMTAMQPGSASSSASSGFARTASWPEIPAGTLFALCAILVGLYCVGLLLPARPEVEVFAGRKEGAPEAAMPEYRKTA